MKKVIFVLVSLLLVSYCWALESAPSNEVGYVKLTCPNGYTNFGLPFVFWDVPTGNVPNYGVESRKPSDIIGSQATPGSIASADRVLIQGGISAYRNTAGIWTGQLETNGGDPGLMEPGRAYWYQNRTANPLNIVLAGQVDKDAGVSLPPAVYPIPTLVVAPGYNNYSWRDSRSVPVAELGLLTAGFVGGTIANSDRVLVQGGANVYYRTSDGVWVGFQNITPGVAYWIQNRHAGTWNYDYHTAIGLPVIENPNTPEIQKAATSTNASVSKTKEARE